MNGYIVFVAILVLNLCLGLATENIVKAIDRNTAAVCK